MLVLTMTVLGIGVVAGAAAPLLVPGRRHMPMVVTIVLGILGSLAGGFMGCLLDGRDPGQPGWLAGAVLGAVVALLLFTAFGRRPAPSEQPSSQ
jgi:uncharacterized membrane protein YeaQ/YmgE (transglycosylase-associated protein family)